MNKAKLNFEAALFGQDRSQAEHGGIIHLAQRYTAAVFVDESVMISCAFWCDDSEAFPNRIVFSRKEY